MTARTGPKPRTLYRRELEREARRHPLPVVPEIARPRTRAECPDSGPCPFVGCRYHLYLDVTDTGGLRLNFPDREPWELEATCALDVAGDGPQRLARIGALLNTSEASVCAIEEGVVEQLHRNAGMRELFGEERPTARHALAERPEAIARKPRTPWVDPGRVEWRVIGPGLDPRDVRVRCPRCCREKAVRRRWAKGHGCRVCNAHRLMVLSAIRALKRGRLAQQRARAA